MRKLQERDIIRVIINPENHSVCAFFADNPYAPAVEVSFSSIVIEDDKLIIEGAHESELIYASLSKISNSRWLVNEVFYQ